MQFLNFHMREEKKYTPPVGVSLRQRKQLRVCKSSSIRCSTYAWVGRKKPCAKKLTEQSYNGIIFIERRCCIAGFLQNVLIKTIKKKRWMSKRFNLTRRHAIRSALTHRPVALSPAACCWRWTDYGAFPSQTEEDFSRHRHLEKHSRS